MNITHTRSITQPPPKAPLAKSKERIKYVDPDSERYKWAQSLRPDTCGKAAGNKKLDEWLIKAMSCYGNPEQPPDYCIIGSRILQRIAGLRYGLGTLESGREIYQSNDIDIWVKDRTAQDLLITYIKSLLDTQDSNYELLHAKDVHLYKQGIYLYSITVREKRQTDENLGKVSSIDISAPLASEDIPGGEDTSQSNPLQALTKAQKRIEHFLGKATPLWMGTIWSQGQCSKVKPYTLDDLDYLESLDNALSNPDCLYDTYEKLQNTASLLLYLEVTRRLSQGKQVDDFCIRLIKLVCAHTPQQHEKLQMILPQLEGFMDSENIKRLPTCLYEHPAPPRLKKEDTPAPPKAVSPPIKPKKSKAITIIDPYTRKEVDIGGVATTKSSQQTLSAPEPEPVKTGLPLWADIAQTRSKVNEKQTTTGVTVPQKTEPEQWTSHQKKPLKYNSKKNQTSSLQTDSKRKTQPPKKVREEQAYLSKEQLTPELFMRVSDRMKDNLSHDEKLGILFDEGIEYAMLQEEADSCSEAMMLLVLLKEPTPSLIHQKPEPAAPSNDLGKSAERVGASTEASGANKSAKKKKANKKDKKNVAQAIELLSTQIDDQLLFPVHQESHSESQLTTCLIDNSPFPPPKAPADPDYNSSYSQIYRLKKLMPSFQPTLHTGVFGWGSSPVMELSDNQTCKKTAVKQFHNVSFPSCPYVDYLEGILYPDNNTDPNGRATQCLLHAATSGVTGAAISLIHRSLNRDRLLIPLSVTMALLKHCVERPADRQYSLRFQLSPFRSPYSCSDRVIAVIEQHLQPPMTNDAWVNMAQQLVKLSHTMPEKQERCLLLAACAFNAGNECGKAMDCRKKIQRQLATLPNTHAFDWFMQSLPQKLSAKTCQGSLRKGFTEKDISLSDELKEWPLAAALEQILIQNNEGLDKAIVALAQYPELTDGQWFVWLPFCMPRGINLEWMTQKDVIKQHWAHMMEVKNMATPRPQTTDSPQIGQVEKNTATQRFNPMEARALEQQLKSHYPDGPRQVARDLRKSDTTLMMELEAPGSVFLTSLSFPPEVFHKPLSPVERGCQITAEALRILGACKGDDSPFTINLHNIQPDTCAPAMEKLKVAAQEYANPHACWLYARLLRPKLVVHLTTEQGKKEWYEKYLSLMLFATQMGVTGAANDLMGEALAGRADGMLTPITALLCRRYSISMRSSIQFLLPPVGAHPFMTHMETFNGHPTKQVWGQHIQSGLHSLCEEQKNCSSPVHQARLAWICGLLSNFLPGSVRKESFTLDIYELDLNPPVDLQVSMIMSLEHLGQYLPSGGDRVLRGYLSPSLNKLLDNVQQAKKRVPEFLKQDALELLPWLQWQLGSSIAVEQNLKLKPLIAKSHPDMYKKVTANECMLRFLWCSLLTDPKTRKFPECREPCMVEILPWVATTRLVSQGESAQLNLITPSAGLASVAQTLRNLDASLCAHLSRGEDIDIAHFPLAEVLKGAGIKRCGTRTFRVDSLQYKDVVTVLLAGVNALQGLNPSDPYPILITALCIEGKHGRNANDAHITEAGVHLVKAAMLGSDCAVQNLARLALVRHNSPVALERVLDMYLLQSQRELRHKLYFDFPNWHACSREQVEIIETIERICLCNDSPHQDVEQLISESLIPALSTLYKRTEHVVTKSQLGYLLSCCYHKIGQSKCLSFFDKAQLKQLPTALLLQWKHHMIISREKCKDLTKLNACVEALTEHTSRQHFVYPMIPYQVSSNENNLGDLAIFIKWNSRPGSWKELPVLMGQSELAAWQEKTLQS